MPRENLALSDFNYRLPKELIAQYPSSRREASRLLVLERDTGRITHRKFTDIIDYFAPGDCLVLNDTKVVCARLLGRREKTHPKLGGGKQEIFLLENLSDDTCRVLAKPAKKLTVGTKILFGRGEVCATVLSSQGMSKIVKFSGNGAWRDIWRQFGEVPLPPYIKRQAEGLDKQRYQTVYARCEGASAAPTAGLHFSEKLLRDIQQKGANLAYVTLHISYGTFAPVKSEDITKHKMHREYFILPEETAKAVNTARGREGNVFAVGTTSVRVLETSAVNSAKGKPLLKGASGFSELFIYPPHKFKLVDRLLTNFHVPQSTLLMLVSAFAGRELILRAYQEAVKERYRFFSYGDAMLII